MLNYISFARNSSKAVAKLDDDFDVVLGYQLSPISSMCAALKYKKRTGAPVLYYTLDIWPVFAEGMLKSKKNPLMWPVKRMSRKIYQGADRILVTSRPFIDYQQRVNGVEMERLAYLPQHADSRMLEMDMKADDNAIADFLFAGNIGKGSEPQTGDKGGNRRLH